MKIRKESTNLYHRRRRSACLAGTSTRRWTCCILPSYPNNIYLSTVFVSTIMCVQNKRVKVKRFKGYLFFTVNIINILFILHSNTYANSIWNQPLFYFSCIDIYYGSMCLLEPILDVSLVIILITVKMPIGCLICTCTIIFAQIYILICELKCTPLVLLWHFVSYLNNWFEQHEFCFEPPV